MSQPLSVEDKALPFWSLIFLFELQFLKKLGLMRGNVRQQHFMAIFKDFSLDARVTERLRLCVSALRLG